MEGTMVTVEEELRETEEKWRVLMDKQSAIDNGDLSARVECDTPRGVWPGGQEGGQGGEGENNSTVAGDLAMLECSGLPEAASPPQDLASGSRTECDSGFLCANGDILRKVSDLKKSEDLLYSNGVGVSDEITLECKQGLSEAFDKPDDSGGTIMEQSESYLSELKYNFDKPIMALNYLEEFKTPTDNFTKGCKWSPDGSCLLVASNDSKLRLLNLPHPVVSGEFQNESWFMEDSKQYTKSAITVQERELVYDYSWYPLMRSDQPHTCCFAVTCRDQPVHLWDAWDGRLICSYHSYNHLDQMVAAYSVGFNLDGSQMVAGFKKCIRLFHTSRPGRYFEQIDAKEQPGIISCMSFNPQLPSIFAAGSYLGSVGLYNTERNNLFCRLEGNIGGVTHVKFSNCGIKLFSGSRKNNEILCWDMRNPGTVLSCYKRQVSTSQRIYFDLDPQFNRFLVSGATSGEVMVWDLSREREDPAGEEEELRQPSTVFTAHKDCTNGVSVHPYSPLLATCSGQRHFPEPVSDSDSCSENEETSSLFTRRGMVQENTVKLWWLAG